MEKVGYKNIEQKCWYCNRNNADPDSLNVEESQSTNVTIKGIYKYKKTTKRNWKVVRCTECKEIHKKGDAAIGIITILAYISSYITVCFFFEDHWFKYIVGLFLALFPTYVIAYVITFCTGHFYAIKYNTKTRWSRGGDVL